jgi:hypothetical protein
LYEVDLRLKTQSGDRTPPVPVWAAPAASGPIRPDEAPSRFIRRGFRPI